MTSSYGMSHSPGHYGTESLNPQYFPQYGQSIANPYSSSTFASGSLPSNMTTMPQESPYPYPTADQNGVYIWPSQSRSMSTGESEEVSQGFASAYRTQTYPSFERRMTGEMQQLPVTSSNLMSTNMESQQSPVPPNFREPTSFQPLHADVRHDWAGRGPNPPAHLPSSPSGPYMMGWYPNQPGLTEVREEQNQPHVLPSQIHNPRRSQHKPG